MSNRIWAVTAALATAAGAVWLTAAAARAAPGEVAYPQGFRAWTHVGSGLIGPGNPAFARYGGIHSIYANARALEGYRTGRFPDGSVLVFDVFALADDEASHTSRMTDRRLVDIMEKDQARFAATGGWGYGEFNGSSHTERSLTQAQAVTACHGCHQTRKAADFVFSKIVGADAMPDG